MSESWTEVADFSCLGRTVINNSVKSAEVLPQFDSEYCDIVLPLNMMSIKIMKVFGHEEEVPAVLVILVIFLPFTKLNVKVKVIP